MDFVSLHSHSTFSFADGYGTPADHIQRVSDLGMNALALTEHGNVSSHYHLEQAAKRAGIKPIFGLEAYCFTTEGSRYKHHLILLAMNQEGYRNLMALVTRSWERFHYEPTVHGEDLAELCGGIAVLSGCSGSRMACALLGGKGEPEHELDMASGMAVARKFQRLLGGNYYLEVQAFPELARTKAINTALEHISDELGIPLVATCDVHYPLPEDNDMQLILHAQGRGSKTVEAQAADWEYSIELTFPENDDELLASLTGTGLSRRAAKSALENSSILADRCDVELPRAKPQAYPGTEDEMAWPENR